MKDKKISTFNEYRKNQEKRLNENINIECEWWDQAIVEVIQEIEKVTYNNLTLENLMRYIENKNSILGKETPGYENDAILQYIKDLIFQFHGDSICYDGGFGGENMSTHSKGVVIEELANVIFTKLMRKVRPEIKEPSEPTAKLVDRETQKLVPMKTVPTYGEEDDCEFDPTEFECKKVKGFEDYSRLVEDYRVGFCKLKLANYDGVLFGTLQVIKDEVGSLNRKDIDAYAKKNAESGENQTDMVLCYIRKAALDQIIMNGTVVLQKGKEIQRVPKDLIRDGLDVICDQIADDVMAKINEK